MTQLSTHLTHDELILVYYREGGLSGREDHAAGCPDCSAALASLAAVLDAVKPQEVPEPSDGYEARVWDRLQWRLGNEHRAAGGRRVDRWIAAAAIVAIGFVSTLLMTRDRRGEPLADGSPAPAAATSESPANRVLQAAVDRHFAQSERVFLELANTAGDDVALDRERARNLLASNRLYRHSATESGEGQLATLLDELEPVLLQIAHTPDQPDPEELKAIRERVQSKDLVFKLRVLRAGLRHQPNHDATSAAAVPEKPTGI